MSALVLLLCTRCLRVSLAATVAIALILATVVGALACDGWQLGVTESVVMSIAVGMAVDFVVHYGYAFVHSERVGRAARVADSMEQMGVSLAMGALTTLTAGLMLLPSKVLFYWQFGVFLALTMAVSWFFANFFFMPLLSFVGPVEGSCRCDSSNTAVCPARGPDTELDRVTQHASSRVVAVAEDRTAI
jgi:predicted RND superfamily exporter protein